MSPIDIFIIALVFVLVVLVIRRRIKLQAAGGCDGCSSGSCSSVKGGGSCPSCSAAQDVVEKMDQAAKDVTR